MSSSKSKKRVKDEYLHHFEPYWHFLPSPYYKQTHFDFRDKIRAFIDTEVSPFVDKWDEKKTYPISLHRKAYEYGIYSPQFPVKYGGQPPKDYDYFHFFIYNDEMARCGAGGIVAALFISMQIGLSPLMYGDNENLRLKIAPQVIKGEKIIALAVTEPSGGSDVSRMKTVAITDPNDDNYYIVNGEKYFITSGMNAHYFTTAVRTKEPQKGEKIHDCLSFLLIEKSMHGVTVSRMKTQGWWSSNTAYVLFKNVRVPKSHLIGKENQGWKIIMHNFNHERFALAVHSNRYSRICLKDAILYAKERKTFGKSLIKHQVIRHKIVEMIRKIETTHSLFEQIAYMMNDKTLTSKDLAGICAIAKVQASKTMEFCAREAVQIFGGRGYLRTGRAARVERLYREVRVSAIGGGSEEILIDLAAKQAKL